MRYKTLAIALFLVAFGGVGCVSEAEHDRVARELKRSEIESAQRAGEVIALKQMLLYYTSYYSNGQQQPQSQAAMMELGRAYSELVRRYTALAADVDALKHRSDPAPAPAVTTAQRKPLPPGIDPFMDR